MAPITIIHGIGAILFALASIAFLSSSNKDFQSSVLVTGITALSYFVMIQGGVAGQTGAGEPIHFSRWVGYALSCSLLMVVISKGIENWNIRKMIIGLTPLVMLSGAVGAVLTGINLWAAFLLGTVWYLFQLKMLYTHSSREHMAPYNKYIVFGWTGFPVAFLLSPIMLGVIGSYTAAVIYLLLDLFTKIMFYVELNINRREQ